MTGINPNASVPTRGGAAHKFHVRGKLDKPNILTKNRRRERVQK